MPFNGWRFPKATNPLQVRLNSSLSSQSSLRAGFPPPSSGALVGGSSSCMVTALRRSPLAGSNPSEPLIGQRCLRVTIQTRAGGPAALQLQSCTPSFCDPASAARMASQNRDPAAASVAAARKGAEPSGGAARGPVGKR